MRCLHISRFVRIFGLFVRILTRLIGNAANRAKRGEITAITVGRVASERGEEGPQLAELFGST